jgi:glycine/D-amino acid oxidase-like deaminating enzyme
MNVSTAQRFDVAIIGGIIGSRLAYFLLKEAPSISVCVIEPDPTCEFASALRASGGCRVQFTRPENIAMSLFGIDFIKRFETDMSIAGRPAPTPKKAFCEGAVLGRAISVSRLSVSVAPIGARSAPPPNFPASPPPTR